MKNHLHHRAVRRGSRRHSAWKLIPAFCLGFASPATSAFADTTATLTGLGATNDAVPVDHGSNAEVTLAWQDTWDQYAEWNGRGDVYQLDQPVMTLMFSPTSSKIKVNLQQFELDEWAGGGDTSARWSVVGSASGLLASGIWDTFSTAKDPNDAGGRSVVMAGAKGAAGESLTLTIDHANTGSGSYLALDNLVFSTSVVPEPTSAALMTVGGLGALAMRKRREQRSA